MDSSRKFAVGAVAVYYPPQDFEDCNAKKYTYAGSLPSAKKYQPPANKFLFLLMNNSVAGTAVGLFYLYVRKIKKYAKNTCAYV